MAALGLHWTSLGQARAFCVGGEQGLVSSCNVQNSHRNSFSCCGVRALGTPASVVWARGLSCSVARGIFLDQGSNPCLLHWQMDSHPLYQKGSAISYVLKMSFAGATFLNFCFRDTACNLVGICMWWWFFWGFLARLIRHKLKLRKNILISRKR